jgi:phosphate transport system protein
MRDAYHDDLLIISERLVLMTEQVGKAISSATEALLATDVGLAEQTIAADRAVDAARDDLDDRVVDLMARQQPVAGELRIVVAALRMADDIERMGDLALHIAKLARLRYPDAVIPADLRVEFAAMGATARRLADRLAGVIAEHDEQGAAELDRDDDDMDRAHHRLFAVLTGDDWQHGVETAIDVTLASRYYERYADHAVKAARRVHYLVTGARQPERPATR